MITLLYSVPLNPLHQLLNELRYEKEQWSSSAALHRLSTQGHNYSPEVITLLGSETSQQEYSTLKKTVLLVIKIRERNK